jgi:mannose-6-phosphate isomerase-like protein (cupin superfamily)
MPTPIGPFNLASTFLRLRTDSLVDPLPVTADFWQKLMTGAIELVSHDRLVTMISYDSSWPNAEMHPNGDEVVCLLSGRATMVLFGADGDGREKLVELTEPGAYVVVPKGTWHTARTNVQCTMLFITAGEGTQSRKNA